MELEQAEDMIQQIHSDWKLIDVHHIERVWIFSNFEAALEFVNAAGQFAKNKTITLILN